MIFRFMMFSERLECGKYDFQHLKRKSEKEDEIVGKEDEIRDMRIWLSAARWKQ